MILLAVAVSELVSQPGAVLDVSVDSFLNAAEVDRAVAEFFSGTSAPSARYAVDVYLIRFASSYPDGEKAEVIAQVFLPRLPRPMELPVYVFAPGTTGLTDACRGSREHVAGIDWGLYRSHVLSHAGQGVIGVLPDYVGFGDPDRLQPYYVARTEGEMMLNAVRAVHRVTPMVRTNARPAEGAFLAGYSQGGHAAFAAADIRAEYAPDVRLGGIIGYGPATDLEAMFREFTVVAPLVVYTYWQLYGREAFDPALILADRWVESLEDDVTRQCIGGIQSYYPWSAQEMFRPEFADALLNGRLAGRYPEIHRILAENSTGLGGHGVPALILQGTDDIVVYESSQADFVVRLRRAGSDVRYIVYPDERHDTRQAAFGEVQRWMREQREGAEERREGDEA